MKGSWPQRCEVCAGAAKRAELNHAWPPPVYPATATVNGVKVCDQHRANTAAAR